MIILQNLHQHSTWCDGRDSVEAVIEGALSQGFDSIGFSVHSSMFYAPSHGIADGYEEGYISEVRDMAKRYEDRIKVFCGVELDFYSKFEPLPYDYIIGSVHYLKIGDEYVGFDRNAATVKSVIDTYFGGDGMQYAKAYYETLARFPERRKIDVIGHFDLITKHSEKENFFDWDSPVYQRYATEAMDALIPHVKIMEINTGAIARGYRTTPYPTAFLLKEWKKRGGEIIISSDCHDQRFLTCGFAESIELAKSCGYTHTQVLTENRFEPVALDEMKKKLLL